MFPSQQKRSLTHLTILEKWAEVAVKIANRVWNPWYERESRKTLRWICKIWWSKLKNCKSKWSKAKAELAPTQFVGKSAKTCLLQPWQAIRRSISIDFNAAVVESQKIQKRFLDMTVQAINAAIEEKLMRQLRRKTQALPQGNYHFKLRKFSLTQKRLSFEPFSDEDKVILKLSLGEYGR